MPVVLAKNAKPRARGVVSLAQPRYAQALVVWPGVGTKVVDEVVDVVELGVVLVEPAELDDMDVMELEEPDELEVEFEPADVEADELKLEEEEVEVLETEVEVVELADVDVEITELEDAEVEVVEPVELTEPLALVEVLVLVPLLDAKMLVDVEVGKTELEELLELEAVRLYIWRRFLAPQYSYLLPGHKKLQSA